MRQYFNYHKHSHISNLMTIDSNTRQEDYARRYAELGQTCFSTCEHGTNGDIFEAKSLCDKYSLKCISVGEFYIVPDPLEKDKSNYHIIIAPRTDAVRKLVNYASSHANIDGYYYKPRLFIEDLLAIDKDDLLITTACVAGLLRDETSYQKIFLPLYEHFGDNVLLEVQAHDVDIQKEINRKALALHEKYGLRLVAACDSHYIDEEGRRERETLLKGKGMSYPDENAFVLDFPDGDTLYRRFQEQGVLSDEQIKDAMENSLLFEEAEPIQLDYSIKMPTIYPDLTLDERLQLLKDKVNKGFNWIRKEEGIKGDELKRYIDGIRYEMKTIEDTNEEIHTADYFLLDEKMVDIAQKKYGGVLTRGGRGSAGSFYINRILSLTQLDRFKIDLPIYPDRFMSTARLLENRSLPDIDLNVEAQEPFVKATRDLLGEHGCYPMYAPGCLQEKESFKNLCREKGIPFDVSNEISQNLDTYREDPKWKSIIEEAQKYIGTIVSGSVHPCAHLLDNKDLRYEYGVVRFGDNLCILVTSSEADEWKLLKNDYLIVSVWHLIAETFRILGNPIIPARQLLADIKDDERIWNLFRDGITCTLNQVDSSNGTQQAQQYGIRSFEEGALIAAAIRPSFDSWREKFLNREEYSTGMKQLDEVLEQSQHYILFQECLMAYFQWLDVTPAESIGLIKKISKKKIHPEDFAQLEDRIRSAWKKNVGSEDGFDDTWQMIQSCMSYGFCSAHAAATSLDMCYGAWLKVHYPLQYYTVCFNTYAKNADKTQRLVQELPYFGLSLKNIRFRFSKAGYSFDEATNTIYKGISSLSHLSVQAAEDLYALRDKEFSSFIDLLVALKDTSVNSRQLEILTKLDFFQEFGSPNELLSEISAFEVLYGRKTMKVKDVEDGKYRVPEYLVAKYAGKKTEKTYAALDSLGLLKEYVRTLPPQKTPLLDRLSYELEGLGYCTTTDPRLRESICYVTDVNGSYRKKYVSFYRVWDGKAFTYKTEVQAPFNKGSLLEILEIEKKCKYRKIGEDPKTKKPVFEKTTELEDIVTKYRIVRTQQNLTSS